MYLFQDKDIPKGFLRNLVEELPQAQKVPEHLDEHAQEATEAFLRVWSPLKITSCRRMETAENHNEGLETSSR